MLITIKENITFLLNIPLHQTNGIIVCIFTATKNKGFVVKF